MKGRKTFMGKIDVATKQYMSHENVIAEIGEMNTEIKNAFMQRDYLHKKAYLQTY